VLVLPNKASQIDPTFCSMLFSPGCHVRVIVIASSDRVARRGLPGKSIEQMQHIWIRPIGARAGELPAIFDRLFHERDAPIRLANLTRANRERLVGHEWRGNWHELRVAAERLSLIARTPNWEALDWRERAAALGIAKSTLYDWYKLLHLAEPLFVRPM
jgi:hypothetical protein